MGTSSSIVKKGLEEKGHRNCIRIQGRRKNQSTDIFKRDCLKPSSTKQTKKRKAAPDAAPNDIRKRMFIKIEGEGVTESGGREKGDRPQETIFRWLFQVEVAGRLQSLA